MDTTPMANKNTMLMSGYGRDLTLNDNKIIKVFKPDTKWVVAERLRRILADGGGYCWQIMTTGTFLDCDQYNNAVQKRDLSTHTTKILPLERYHELVYGDNNWSEQ